jgi:hypothetical protein
MPRVHHGGSWSPVGSENSNGVSRTITVLSTNKSSAASAKIEATTITPYRYFVVCDQSTPEVPARPRKNPLVMPTPMIDPIKVCELEGW